MLLYLLSFVLISAQVNNKICPDPSKQINAVSSLPRFDQKGRLGVSPNWGSYDLFNCTTDPVTKDQSCSFRTITDVPGFYDYVTSLAFYPGFAFAMFVILLLSAIFLFIGRYCCCCVRGGLCGKRWPTRKTERCCFCLPGMLGYVRLKVDDQGNGTEFGYPDRYRWANRVYMWIFVFFLLLWVGMGHFQGNQALTASMVSVAESPTTLVNSLLATVPVFASYGESLIGTDFVNFITNLNTTVNNVTSVNDTIADLNCVIDAVFGLPDVSDVKAFVKAQLDALTNTSNIVQAMNDSLTALQKDKDDINASIADLTQLSLNISAQINATADNISNTLQQSQELDFIQNNLLNKTNGIGTIVDDMSAMDNNKPNSTEINDLTGIGGQPDSISSILAPTEIPAVNRSAMIAKLIDMQTRYNSFPDFNKTADNMELFNQNLVNITQNNMTAKLRKEVNDSQNALDNLFSDDIANEVNASIQVIKFKIHNISWGSLYNIVDVVNKSLNTTATVDAFQKEFKNITDLVNIIPCINRMIGSISKVNQSLIRFPDSVQDQFTQINSLNDTLNNVTQQLNNFTSTLNDYFNKTLDLNLSDMRAQIQKLQNDTNANADAVDANGIVDRIRNANNASNITTFAKIQSDLDTLDNALANSSIDPNLIAQFRNLSILVKQIQSDLNRTVADLTYWNLTGYCSGTTSITNCTGDLDCPPAETCTGIGLKRCKLNATVSCLDSSGDSDSHCLPNDYCIVSTKRLNNLTFELEASELAFTDNNSTQQSLERVNNSLITDLQTGYGKQISDSANALKNVSTSTFLDNIQNLSQSLNSFNISNSTSQFQDLLNQLNNLNLSSIYNQVDSLNSTTDALNQGKKYLNETSQLLETFRAFLFDKLPGPNGWLANISTATLKNIRVTQGLSAEFFHITSTIDSMIAFINDGQSLLPEINVSLTNSTQIARTLLNVVSDDNTTKQGPYHFIFAVKDAISNETTIIYPGQNDNQILVDTNGQAYPDDKKCYTNKCVANSINYYNNAPASSIISNLMNGFAANSSNNNNCNNQNGNTPNNGGPNGGSSSSSSGGSSSNGNGCSTAKSSSFPNIPVSRTQIVDAPYLIPFFIALFATASSVLLFPGKMSDFWSSCLASCTACLVCCQMPFIFLFAGFAFFVPILGGDACRSVEDVGYQYLSKTNACNSFNGNGTPANCSFAYGGTNGPEYNFSLDILETYKQVLGGCDPQSDALNPIYSSARGLAINYLPTELDNQVADFNNPNQTGGLFIQPALTNVISKLGKDVGNSTAQFITDFQGQVGCDDLHNVYAAAKNSLCCDVMTSIYWMVASWYLLAWSMLICGWGASLLGRKRFPYAIWGSHYDEDMRAKQENSEVMIPNEDLVGGHIADGHGQPEMLEDSRLPAPSRGMSMAATPGMGGSHTEHSGLMPGLMPEPVQLDELKASGSGSDLHDDPMPHVAPQVEEEEHEFEIEPINPGVQGDGEAGGGGLSVPESGGNEGKEHSEGGQETWGVQ